MISFLGGWHEGLAEIGKKDGGFVKLDVLAPGSEPGRYDKVGGNTGRERLLPSNSNDLHWLLYRVTKGLVKLICGHQPDASWKSK